MSFRIDSIYGRSDGGGENGDGKEGSVWRFPGLLYSEDLVLCGKLEEDLRPIVDILLRCVEEV